jgi:hypothetical protein
MSLGHGLWGGFGDLLGQGRESFSCFLREESHSLQKILARTRIGERSALGIQGYRWSQNLRKG